MGHVKLSNGCDVVLYPAGCKSVAVMAMFSTGSVYEDDSNRGISHFLEHMFFEGTKKRPDSRIIANEIESRGGEINAYTDHEKTAYYVKILGKHLLVGMELLSDILSNSVFCKDKIKKEKRVICNEISLYRDQPVRHQWELFLRALYKKHPAKHPIIGYSETVNAVSRRTLIDYYKKHYTGRNMTLVIAGSIADKKAVLREAERLFSGLPCRLHGKKDDNIIIEEPVIDKLSVVKDKRKIDQSYAVFGFNTAPRSDADSYVLDVIHAVLGRGQSGWLFEEVRNRQGLAYQIGTNHEPSQSFGHFSVYVNTHKKNIQKIVRVFYEQCDKIMHIPHEELKEAKEYVEGNFLLRDEDTKELANTLGFFRLSGIRYDDYLDRIGNVSVSDIRRVVKKYFTKDYAMGVIEES